MAIAMSNMIIHAVFIFFLRSAYEIEIPDY